MRSVRASFPDEGCALDRQGARDRPFDTDRCSPPRSCRPAGAAFLAASKPSTGNRRARSCCRTSGRSRTARGTSSSRIRPNVADATALLLAAGVADTVAMRTVGHADARILARYQDVVTELQRDAAARMDSLLGARPRDCDQKCDPPEDRRAAKLPLTWSGRRDSNPRPPPWQGGALPLSHVRVDLRV
jgi:hypothetical protein